jgi:hypothetical protein
MLLEALVQRFRPLMQLVPAVLLVACGNQFGPVDLEGRWAVTAYYAGGTLRCTVRASLEFPADPASGPGSYQDERVDCFDGTVPLTTPLRSYGVVHSIENLSFAFVPYPNVDHTAPDAPCSALRFEGNMGTNFMRGTVHTLQLPCQGTYLLMQGTWRATRVAG